MRKIYRTFCALMLFFCVATANASLIQDFYFFEEEPGSDLDLSSALFSFTMEFPEETGCVSGLLYVAPTLDCPSIPLPESPVSPTISDFIYDSEPVPGSLLFVAGAWGIDENWFLQPNSFFSLDFTNADIRTPFAFIGLDFPFPETGERIGTIGGGETEVAEGFALAIPAHVPTPATLALFSIGLVGLGWSRRKKA
jgi:PEP-CTERM motif-containing protein